MLQCDFRKGTELVYDLAEMSFGAFLYLKLAGGVFCFFLDIR